MSDWNVISAGPSGMKKIPKTKMLKGPVVAVNAAAAAHPYADYYACVEQPGAMAVKMRLFNPEYRSPQKLAKEYGATWWAQRWQYARAAAKWGFKSEFPGRPYPWPSDIWNTDSLTFAIGCAINKGATRIRVFGADHKGGDPLRPEHVHEGGWDVRWAVESKRFETLVAEAAQHNIEIKKANADVSVRKRKRKETGGGAPDERDPGSDQAQGGDVQPDPGVQHVGGADRGEGSLLREPVGVEARHEMEGGGQDVRSAGSARDEEQAGSHRVSRDERGDVDL